MVKFAVELYDMNYRDPQLYEITQMKGDGEAHPILSPDTVHSAHD